VSATVRGALALATLVAGACTPVRGAWSGRCEYLGPKDALREAKLSIELEPPEAEGIGRGTARVTEDGDTQRADVVYLAAAGEIAIDLYLDDDEVFLRGTLDGGSAKGTCGSPVVEQFSVGELVDCVAELEVDCDTSPEWTAKKGEPAPIERRDLDGDFRLSRD